MSKGGSNQPSGQTVTTSTQDPWAGLQPYLGYGLGEAMNQYQNAPQEFFPGSTVAPQSADTIAAQNLIRLRALGGNPLNAMAQQGAVDTLQGSWLGGPRYQEMYGAAVRPAMQQFTEQVLPGITSQFARSGRLGSNQQQELLSRTQSRANNSSWCFFRGRRRWCCIVGLVAGLGGLVVGGILLMRSMFKKHKS